MESTSSDLKPSFLRWFDKDLRDVKPSLIRRKYNHLEEDVYNYLVHYCIYGIDHINYLKV